MEESNKYYCSGNGKPYEGKPWIKINYQRWDGYNGPVCFSSYLEYKYNLDKIPKQHFHLIMNKEDFNQPYPVINKPSQESFRFLTETELDELSNEEYQQYQLDLGDHFLINPLQSEIYHEGIRNDAHVRNLEEEFTSDDDSLLDDY